MAGSFEESVQRWGVLVGSPNTTVEIEFPRMCPSDVTLHYVRMPTDGNIADNDLFEGVVQRTTAGIPAAIDSIMTAEPDHLVLGFGSPGFFAGLDGEQALIDSYVERAASASPSRRSHAAGRSRYWRSSGSPSWAPTSQPGRAAYANTSRPLGT